MTLTVPTFDLTGNTIAGTYDQLLFIDGAAITESALFTVSCQDGETALRVANDQILIKDSSGTDIASCFEVQDTDGTVCLSVNGTNNRVGIGTDSPDSAFEIEQGSSGGVVAFKVDNNDTDKVAVSIEAANIDADVMDITADAVTTANVIDITADGLTSGSALYIDSDSSSTSTRNIVNIIQNHASASGAVALRVQQDSTADIVNIFDGGTEVFTILNGGNVGIGITTPTALFEVVGNSAEATAISDVITAGCAHFRGDSDSTWGVTIGSTGTNRPLLQGVNTEQDGTRELLLQPYGNNVGIGTVAPTHPLEVVADKDNGTICLIHNTGDDDDDDVLQLKLGHTGHPNTDNIYIRFSDAGGDLDTIRGDDAGGIETTIAIASDSRIKKDVVNLTGGLDKINALRPVSFNYTDEYLNHKLQTVQSKEWWKDVQAGFIAQEFEQCFPVNVRSSKERVQGDNVSYDGNVYNDQDHITVKKIDLSRDQIVLSYIVKAIQELSAKVTTLASEDAANKVKITALETKDTEYAATITALTARITALENA